MIYLQLYKCSARVIINKLTDTKTFLHVSHSMYVTPVAIVVTWSSREICLVSDKRRVTFRSISKVHLTQLGSLRFYSVHKKNERSFSIHRGKMEKLNIFSLKVLQLQRKVLRIYCLYMNFHCMLYSSNL